MKPLYNVSNRDLAYGLLLFVATFLAYLPALNGSLVWDDELHVTPPESRSVKGLVEIWTHPRGTVQYFPLAHTVFWVETRLWGDSTPGFHLVNILLHFFSALLLVRIVRKLGIPGPWLAGGIFALHPVMVESVAWITELKNALCCVFFLSASLAYLTYAENGKKRSYVSALGFFVLALLSKTGVAPFPLAMLAAIWWKRGGLSWKRDAAPLIPFFLAGFFSGLVTLYMERTHIGTKGPDWEFSFVQRCLIAGRALWFYLGKIFLPVNLTISYPRWVVNAAAWRQYLFPAAALAAGGVAWTLRKKRRAPAAAYFYFTAMLLPYLGFANLFAFRYSFVADHYQYLAAIGPIVISAGLMEKAVGFVTKVGGRVLAPAAAVVLLSTLGALSWRQSRMYSDAETLYRTTIARNNGSWMAHNNLGLLLANSGRTGEAMTQYQKALELNPDYAEANNNLGLLLSGMGRTDEATAHFVKALEINPGYGGAHFNFGLLLAKTGRTSEAEIQYRKALEINPRHVTTLNNLGLLLAGMERSDEAMTQYRKALEVNANSAETHYNFGLLLVNMGRTGDALAHFLKALEINPKLAEAHNNAGILLAISGRFDEAMPHFLKALEINPDYADAHANLGNLLGKMGRTDEAAAHLRIASELNRRP